VGQSRHVLNFTYLAWLGAAAAAVLLLAGLGCARAAAAQPLPPAGSTPLLGHDDFEEEGDEAEGEEGEEGEEAWECESDDEAAEERCEEEAEQREAEEEEAEECRIEGASATVSALPARDQLRLTVHYTTFQPSAVAVDLQLRSGKGGLDLGTETVRFAHSGSIHSSRTLSDRQLARALAAREFIVGLVAVNTPRFCQGRSDLHLTSRSSAGSSLQWSDPSDGRRAKASRAKRSHR
jgi:hypothetical protein